MSSGKCVKLCRFIAHALAPYCSSHNMQYLHARHLKFSIMSSVQPFLPELKTNSTILGTGAQSFSSSSGSNPFKTNSEAGKASFCIPPLQEKARNWLSLRYNINKSTKAIMIEGFRAKRASIAFWVDFHFLQNQANFWQTDLSWT